MPGRKKGQNKGAARKLVNQSVAQGWEDIRTSGGLQHGTVRKGAGWRPSLSMRGQGTLRRLLESRKLQDRSAVITPASGGVGGRHPLIQLQLQRRQQEQEAEAGGEKAKGSSSSSRRRGWNGRAKRPRAKTNTRTVTLADLCIQQIGRDFYRYDKSDAGTAEAFSFLTAPCLSALSEEASAAGGVHDYNVELLCSPLVEHLSLRGSVGEEALRTCLLPALRLQQGSELPGGQQLVVQQRGEAQEEEEEEEEEEESGWEEAPSRLAASASGCHSLTSLELSSPSITEDFVESVITQLPTLRQLGLIQCRSIESQAGPDLLGLLVEGLIGLTSLNLSGSPWFGDRALWRLTSLLSRNPPPPPHRQQQQQQQLVMLQQQWYEGLAASELGIVVRAADEGWEAGGLSLGEWMWASGNAPPFSNANDLLDDDRGETHGWLPGMPSGRGGQAAAAAGGGGGGGGGGGQPAGSGDGRSSKAFMEWRRSRRFTVVAYDCPCLTSSGVAKAVQTLPALRIRWDGDEQEEQEEQEEQAGSRAAGQYVVN